MQDSEPINPYASPQDVSEPPPPPSAAAKALDLLRGPSLALYCFGLIHLLLSVLILLIMIAEFALNARRGEFRLPPPSILVMFVGIPGSVLLMIAARRMRRLRSLRFCRIAAAVACIPYVAPIICVTIPFGIWGLIVLFLPSVANEFDRNPN